MPARYDCPLLGGDTVRTPGPLTRFGDGASARCPRARSCGGRAPRRATGSSSAARSATRRSAWRCAPIASAGALKLPARTSISPTATCCRSRAMRWRRRCAAMPRRPWTSRTGLPATLPSSAGCPASAARHRGGRVPLSRGGAGRAGGRSPRAMGTILSGGDDYEILCTVPPRRVGGLRARGRRRRRSRRPTSATFVAGAGARFLRRAGRPLRLCALSFSHF